MDGKRQAGLTCIEAKGRELGIGSHANVVTVSTSPIDSGVRTRKEEVRGVDGDVIALNPRR